MNPEYLKNKREYDCYIEGMKDAKELINTELDTMIKHFKSQKNFIHDLEY